MSNALIILLAYGFYLFVVGLVVVLSWYAEKLDPSNELPPTLWDEFFPGYSQRRIKIDSEKRRSIKTGIQPVLLN